MRKIIRAIKPFKEEDFQDVNDLINDIFKSTTHNIEKIIVHDCANPDCPMGVLYGLIGDEEDVIIIEDYIEKDTRQVNLADIKTIHKLVESYESLSEEELKSLAEGN